MVKISLKLQQVLYHKCPALATRSLLSFVILSSTLIWGVEVWNNPTFLSHPKFHTSQRCRSEEKADKVRIMSPFSPGHETSVILYLVPHFSEVWKCGKACIKMETIIWCHMYHVGFTHAFFASESIYQSTLSKVLVWKLKTSKRYCGWKLIDVFFENTYFWEYINVERAILVLYTIDSLRYLWFFTGCTSVCFCKL